MSKSKSKRPIRIWDYTRQQVLRRTDVLEAQGMIDSGKAYRLDANAIALYPPNGNNRKRAVQRVWSAAPSLMVSAAVVQSAADGKLGAQEIVSAYGRTSARHEMEPVQ